MSCNNYFTAPALAILSCFSISNADEKVRSEFIRQLNDTSARYRSILEGSCVKGVHHRFSSDPKSTYSQQMTLWQSLSMKRLDLLTTEISNQSMKGVRLSYVLNDYFPFVARAQPSEAYAMIKSGEKDTTVALEVNSSPVIAGYCIEGEPMDAFVKWPQLSCVSIQSDNWKGQACNRFRGELYGANRKLVWWVHIYYLAGDKAPVLGWRSLGYQFGGRNNRGGKPIIEETVLTYDTTKSNYIPSQFKLYELTPSDPASAIVLREEFTLESVTEDPKPRSFFTLSAFGLPEPIGLDQPTPFYAQTWFLSLVGGALVMGGIVLVRRRRSGGTHAT